MHILTIKRNSYPASLAATTKKAFAAVAIMLSMLMSPQTMRAAPRYGGMAGASEKAGYRTIVRVDSVTVNAPAGTAPRLPYQVMVEYSDGSRELRQVRWRNSSEAAEREQAGVWHGLVVLEDDTVLFEVKRGPYAPITADNLAPWTPDAEDRQAVAEFINELETEFKRSDYE